MQLMLRAQDVGWPTRRPNSYNVPGTKDFLVEAKWELPPTDVFNLIELFFVFQSTKVRHKFVWALWMCEVPQPEIFEFSV